MYFHSIKTQAPQNSTKKYLGHNMGHIGPDGPWPAAILYGTHWNFLAVNARKRVRFGKLTRFPDGG